MAAYVAHLVHWWWVKMPEAGRDLTYLKCDQILLPRIVHFFSDQLANEDTEVFQ